MNPLPEDFELVVLDRNEQEVAGYVVREQRAIVLEGGHPATLLLLESTNPAAEPGRAWAVGIATDTVPELVIGRGIADPQVARFRFELRALAEVHPI